MPRAKFRCGALFNGGKIVKCDHGSSNGAILALASHILTRSEKHEAECNKCHDPESRRNSVEELKSRLDILFREDKRQGKQKAT